MSIKLVIAAAAVTLATGFAAGSAHADQAKAKSPSMTCAGVLLCATSPAPKIAVGEPRPDDHRRNGDHKWSGNHKWPGDQKWSGDHKWPDDQKWPGGKKWPDDQKWPGGKKWSGDHKWPGDQKWSGGQKWSGDPKWSGEQKWHRPWDQKRGPWQPYAGKYPANIGPF
ncbi:MAG: hypothetical protein AB7S57_25745 [Acetobacteraceae bacterium]